MTNADINGRAAGEPVAINETRDLRTIMREERNEQLAEEADRKLQASNFGVLEGTGDRTASKDEDNKMIETLIADLGLQFTHKSTYRLSK